MNEIDEIRRQMAQIRHDLHQDVSNVVSGVSDVVNEVSGVMDWRSALRGHPYMLVGQLWRQDTWSYPAAKRLWRRVGIPLRVWSFPRHSPEKSGSAQLL